MVFLLSWQNKTPHTEHVVLLPIAMVIDRKGFGDPIRPRRTDFRVPGEAVTII
jgi:hypothetical protein